jgi:hypothetical protein
VRFTFAQGTTIGAKAYVVVAKNLNAFKAVYPSVPQNLVHGPFVGELDNGGEALTLLNSNAEPVEFVDYDDEFPWPIGADALGNNRDLLPQRRDKFAGGGTVNVAAGGGALLALFGCDESSGAALDIVAGKSIPFGGVFQPNANGKNVKYMRFGSRCFVS